MIMKLYNTLTRKVEDFKPLNPPNVTLYTCGPTVYDFTHIGHMRKYTNDDVLKRVLTYLGYKVKHVMNITDVGHLTSDADAGEDKLEKGAKKYGKTVWEVAEFYTKYFNDTMKSINIIPPDVTPKATDNIKEMIAMNETLVKKGYAYKTDEALYFDVTKFPSYGKLSGQKLDEKKQGARDDVIVDPQKKNPADFVLWFKRVGRFADHTMHWPSPWGEGFPGWHLECSVMSMKYLGETIDIHTGGVDHIPVHHENEIAQSEAVTGKEFVRYWMHYEFLQIDGQKMSKSLGNFYTKDDFEKKGIELMSFRLLLLQTHYRQQMNFTWESVGAAQEAYKRLKETVLMLRSEKERTMLSEEKMEQIDKYRQRFKEALEEDLQLPQAVAVMFEMLKSNIPSPDKLDLIYEFDEVFGLKLREVEEETIPTEITALAEKRWQAKQNKDYKTADEVRKKVEEKGYVIMDVGTTYQVKKK
jgi:cysteinyl-tRNA synthetase